MVITTTLQLDDLAWKSKKTHNWKEYQLSKLKASDIGIDAKIKTFVKSNPTWRFNLTWANPSIKQFASDNNVIVDGDQYDFFVISDMEFGKLPLLEIERLIKYYYDVSKNGGYFAIQSYYLNWQNDTHAARPGLPLSIDSAVPRWVEQYIGVKTYTNDSLKISNPLANVDSDGRLIAGSDFMYTHGNMRIWLWKM